MDMNMMGGSLPPLTESTYCSQSKSCTKLRKPPKPGQDPQQAVERIEKILKKEIICMHDIYDMQQSWRSIDFWERKNTDQLLKMPEPFSTQALNLVKSKLDDLKSKKNLTSMEAISLCHLQHFVPLQLNVKPLFDRLTLEQSQDTRNAIASDLPFCISEAQLNESINSLMGLEISQEEEKILKSKKEHLKINHELKQEIEKEKQKLNDLREQNPGKYPYDLVDLLNNGYIDLYKHIMQMVSLPNREARNTANESISYSDLARIVLETREAIIKKVKHSIPKKYNNFVLLLGGAGVGKSTTRCAFRDDTMILRKDGLYESGNDPDQTIGHARAESRTLLPIVEVIEDTVIVDCPGFHDSNGEIVALGMELALARLVQQYRPKILLLESITNDADRYAIVNQLSRRMDRLFANKADCILGISKYSREPNFIKKKQYEKERLNLINRERELADDIVLLKELYQNKPIPNDRRQKLEAKEQELQQLRQGDELRQLTRNIETCQLSIETSEQEMLNQTGLKHVIRLDELENASTRSKCLKSLATMGSSINNNPLKSLDPTVQELLTNRFRNSLEQELRSTGTSVSNTGRVDTVKTFESDVLSFSLVYSLTKDTCPEIWQFLHLPEMDPRIVREYDTSLVEDCIRHFRDEVIRSFNYEYIEQGLKTKQIKGRVPDAFLSKLNELTNHIQRDLGQKLSNRTDENRREWDKLQLQKLQNDYEKQARKEAKRSLKRERKEIRQRYTLDGWAKALYCAPLGIPYGIHKWREKSALDEVDRNASDTRKEYKDEFMNKFTEEFIQESTSQIDATYNLLIKLNAIKQLIIRRGEIDTLLRSSSLDFTSFEDLNIRIDERIDQVRQVFTPGLWDFAVSHLLEQCRLNPRFRMFFSSDARPYFLAGLLAPLVDPGIQSSFTFYKDDDKKDEVIITKAANKISFISEQKPPSSIGSVFFGQTLRGPQRVSQRVYKLPSDVAVAFDKFPADYLNNPLTRMMLVAAIKKMMQ